MDFQPIRKESPLLMIYDDFSREFYRLLMNLNHELQMSLENQSLLGESGYDRFVPTVTYQKSQLAFNDGLQSVCKSHICKTPKRPKNWRTFRKLLYIFFILKYLITMQNL